MTYRMLRLEVTMDPLKSGFKTSEFYLSAFAVAIGFIQSSGLLESLDNPWWVKLAALAVAMLGALGYTVPRLTLKREAVIADAIKVTSQNSAEKPVNPLEL